MNNSDVVVYFKPLNKSNVKGRFYAFYLNGNNNLDLSNIPLNNNVDIKSSNTLDNSNGDINYSLKLLSDKIVKFCNECTLDINALQVKLLSFKSGDNQINNKGGRI